MIYTSIGGVRRAIGKARVDVAGRNRLIYDGHCGVSGVSRQFLWGRILSEWVDRILVTPHYVDVQEYSNEAGYGEILRTEYIDTRENLAAANESLKDYGSVAVDTDTGTLTVIEKLDSSVTSTYDYPQIAVVLRARIYLVLAGRDGGTGETFYYPGLTPLTAFKDLSYTGSWRRTTTARGSLSSVGCFAWGSSATSEGSWNSPNSGRRTVTVPTNPPNPEFEYIEYDLQAITTLDTAYRGSGQVTCAMTPEAVSFGGATFATKVMFENEIFV